MMRQLGGSFGVALITTYITSRSWTHRQNCCATSRSTTRRCASGMAAVTRGLIARGSYPWQAQQQAYGALEGTVVRQTFLLTYMDAFRVVGYFFLLCIPLLLLFPRRRGGAPVSAAAMH
jgi:DHA2 family multidrug resistance protein